MTSDEQIQNLQTMRHKKEGQIRALEWVGRVIRNQIEREDKELSTIVEDLRSLV